MAPTVSYKMVETTVRGRKVETLMPVPLYSAESTSQATEIQEGLIEPVPVTDPFDGMEGLMPTEWPEVSRRQTKVWLSTFHFTT